MGTSNLDKFLLLMWKNWKLQWKNKRSTIFEILIPILLSSLLVLIRYIVDPTVITNPLLYPELNINLELLKKHMNPNTASPVKKWELAYSPKNNLLDTIVEKASLNLQLTHIGLSNSKELESYMLQQNQSLVGIQFDDNLAKIRKFPSDISYSLRFPSELRAYSIEFPEFWSTQNLYPIFDFGGPRNLGDADGGYPGYIREGFIAVQNAISVNIMKSIAESQSMSVTIPEIKMQRMPYPPYTSDTFLKAVEVFIPLIIVLSYVHLASETIKYVTTEKEKQLKEVMKIMGLSNWLHWLAWFTKTFMLMAISITTIVILLHIKWNSKANVAIFTYTHWSCLLVFLYAYCFAVITYFFMVTTFFTNAKTAAAVNGLIWFMFYIPYTMTNSNYKNLNLSDKLGLCLFHNTALGYGFKLILHYEGTGEGLHWYNLFRPVNIDDNLSVGLIIIMLLFSSILYMTITLYVEKIFPGHFGVPEKWYFPFTKEFWCKKNNNNNDIDYESNNINNNNNNTQNSIEENNNSNKKIGVSIRKLNKKFGDKKAVTDLDMDLYENEITVLLGHNGAGKTTTISMLTGMIPPTSGTATINGNDIRTNLMGVRSSLGLCPQHNILFDNLTVIEHIIFYSRVKGLKGRNIYNEVNKYIKILQLKDKLNTPSKNLSGGMKRKLSVICALCGNTKIVFLDEPSSGMDPSARRSLWDILKMEKKNRTILLTTHYMDEADAIGDRIAIMSDSELKCYGTSFFLKKKYGSGYHLICVKKDDCAPEEITKLLRNYIPNIEIDKNIGTELSYKLPDEYSTKFEEMLGKLEANSNDLKLDGYGISITSLEEVFMQVGSEKPDNLNEQILNINDKNFCDLESTSIDEIGGTVKKYSKTRMCISQWKAMLLKKYLYSKRNYIIFLLQIIIVLFLIIITIVTHNSHEDSSSLPPLLITLDSYADTVNVLEKSNNLNPFELKISNEYENYMKSFGKEHEIITINEPFSDYILKEDLVKVKTKYFAAATIGSNKIIAWFNNQLLHTAPLTISIVHNAIIRAILPNYNIDVTNHPLPKSIKTIQSEVGNGSALGFQLALNLCIGLAFATAFYILFLIKERQSRAKLLQFVSGVRVVIFWLSHLLFDYLTFVIIIILTIITIICFQQEGYTSAGDLGRIFLVLLCFGLAIIPFIYLFSLLFQEPVTGFSYTTLFNIICVALFIIVFVIRMLDKDELATTLNYIFLMFPIYALATSLTSLNLISSMSETCIKQCKYLGLPQSICTTDILCKLDDKCCLTDYFDFKYPGIAWNVIYMILTSLICLILLLIGSLRLVKEFFHKARMLIKPPPISFMFENSVTDDDVILENNRIDNMSTNDMKSTNLILKSATKYYSKLLAVRQVSLGVNHSECFGLLGVNGAGKTTLFKMMTGDEIITYGDAYVKGKNLRNEMNDVYRDIGYCPQFDALLEDLTGREILRIFCLLRGMQEDRINDISNKMSQLLGYTKHIDKPCKTYSGGNKRKLSTSIAILGCPSVIYLDEPTSGMDPGARRQLWNVVSQIRSSGRAIILTSHSMEECEALCTRLAIMVNGEFKCIGSTQHLKNKFAKSLVLKIKAKKDEKLQDMEMEVRNDENRENNENIENIKLFVQSEFPLAVLQEEYQEMLTFNIPISSIKWSQIFGTIERHKETLNIEDYSISQTTLEQIFLSFAQHQREDNRITGSKLGKTFAKQSYIRSAESKNVGVVDV